MSNKEFELVLMNVILILVAIMVLLFIIKGVRILVTKKIESIDDVCFVLFVCAIIAIPHFCWYAIKRRINKPKQTVV